MKYLYSGTIYENPLPQLRARHSMFPGICRLQDGKILALHQMGQAFEAVDTTTFASISEDNGLTWSAPTRIFDKESEKTPVSDNCKPTLLPDGRVIAVGYQFERQDPDLPLGNPETGGLLSDEVFYSISEDGGKTWSERTEIPTAWAGSTEASSPITILADGSLATPITGFPRWDGSSAGRNCGRLLRSFDGGKTWNDDVICTEFPGDTVTCYEQRMCQLEDGSIIVISWNENTETGERMNNHVTISYDNGKTFSKPIDTGIKGQASSILALDGDKFLTVHAIRRDTNEPGIYFCVASIKDGKFVAEKFERVWAPNTPIIKSKHMAEIFAFMKFGQPGAIRLPDDKILLAHWECVDGLYKTITNCYEL